MVTIADVARAAGVSISTVSYVMSGKRTISPETRERVTQAISDLDYSPHASARSLASRATNVIGLQAPLRAGVDVHVVMQIVAGLVTRARALHYDILLLTSDDAEGLAHAARASMVDALLVMDIESDDPRIATLREVGVPSVLIGLPAGADGLVCVDFDFEAAGRLAAARLAELGHRRIALVGAPDEVMTRHTSYADRLVRGFRGEASARGLAAVVHACPSGAEASALIDAVLDEPDAATGLLIHNEGALPHIAARLDARPDPSRDVIALCPPEMALTIAGLSDVIPIPAERIGQAAADAVRALLADQEPDRLLLAPTLASRSDGPVR